jgi:hypothetical protein
MEHDAQAAADEDAGGLALTADDGLLADDGDDGTDLVERFRVAFAEHFTVGGRAGNRKLRVTVAELADLAEEMFLAGVDAMLKELGY